MCVCVCVCVCVVCEREGDKWHAGTYSTYSTYVTKVQKWYLVLLFYGELDISRILCNCIHLIG